MFSTAERLGWPWALHKYRNFANTFTYLGFIWDIANKNVTIPDTKKQKFISRCCAWVGGLKKLLKDAQQLFGLLNHCCLVLRFARVRLHNLQKFIASFPSKASPFLTHTPDSRLLNDIQWWITTLSAPSIRQKIAVPSETLPVQIFVDASTSWGIGILIDNRWAAFRFTKDALLEDRAIGWAEMVAIEIAVLFLTCIFPRSSHFLIHSDNQGVIGAIDSGMSRGASQNTSLSRLSSTLLYQENFISTSYIKLSLNPADPISRGVLPSDCLRLKQQIKLDPCILPFLVQL